MPNATSFHGTVTRDRLLDLLGYPRGLPSDGTWVGDDMAEVQGVHVQLGYVDGASQRLPAILLRPLEDKGQAPVLYAHAHGNRYDIGKSEVIDGRPALLDPPLGVALAQAGHPVLCVDMPGFGARQNEGTESALAKASFWEGRTLLGDMLADQSRAFAALQNLYPDRPIATIGISMGATLAYWFTALEPRVAACAHMCAFANMAPLIADGAHDLHGPYMTVPGLLSYGDMGDVAALIAPRPQLICAGRADPLTPASALDPPLSQVQMAYRHACRRLQFVLDPDAGHKETPKMRAAIVQLFASLPANPP
ncbi:MAG: alpha/beta fold hydrolase [Pseudomonadota bacterium]